MINKLMVIVFSALISIILYQQFSFNRQMSQLKTELINNKNTIYEFKTEQEKIKNEILTSINENNNKQVNELNEKLIDIQNTTDNIISSNNGVSIATRDYETSIDNRSSTSKDNYIKTINPLFTESIELLSESSRAADECIEKAITLQSILDEQYKIINEKND